MIKYRCGNNPTCPHCAGAQALNTWVRHPNGAATYVRELRRVMPADAPPVTDKQITLGALVQAMGSLLGETLRAETDDTTGARTAHYLHLFNQALAAEVSVQAVVVLPQSPPGPSDPGTRH